MTGTLALTNNGTVSLDLSFAGQVTVESAFLGTFLPGGLGAQFLCGAEIVLTGEEVAVNSVSYVDVNTGFTVATDTVSPQSTGSTILDNNAFAFQGSQTYALSRQLSPVGFTVAKGSAGSLVNQASVAGLGTSLQFFPSSMYPFNHGGHVGLVVDPQGIVFDTSTNSYIDATFFPAMNASPPPGSTSFAGGFADTTTGHNFLAYSQYETVSPFAQRPTYIEETNQGTAVAVYTYVLGDSINAPGDVYNIVGNTPEGFFFVTENGIGEIKPTAGTYTFYQFAAQDTVAAGCLHNVLFQDGLYVATKDSVGNWLLCDSNNASSCSGGDTIFNFATSGASTTVSRELYLSSISGTHGTPLSVQGTYNYQNTGAPAALDLGYIQPDNSIIWVAPAGDTIGTSTPTGALTVAGATLA